MFALLFFMATGCSDDQEIFFEDYAQEEAPEVVHPDQRDKPIRVRNMNFILIRHLCWCRGPQEKRMNF